MAVVYFQNNAKGRKASEKIRVPNFLSATIVCPIYNLIHKEDLELTDLCMRYMQSHSEEILANGSAMRMNDAALFKFLAPTSILSVESELELVPPMIRWADDKKIGVYDSDTATIGGIRRKYLDCRMKYIHFGAMTLIEFIDCIDEFGEGFFYPEEVMLTIQQIVHQAGGQQPNDPDAYPFLSTLRTNGIVEASIRIASKGPLYYEDIRSHVFTIDVSHTNGPFKLTGLECFMHENTTVCTKQPVPFVVAHNCCTKLIKFTRGLDPDEHGLVSLVFKSDQQLVMHALDKYVMPPNSPKIRIDCPMTCVKAITYTCPKSKILGQNQTNCNDWSILQINQKS